MASFEINIDMNELTKAFEEEIQKRYGVSPSRLMALAEADKAGLCVVLPCKVGDTVFQINQTDVFAHSIKKLVYDCGQIAFDETAIGVYIFTDLETAEAALKERRGE